MKGNIKPHIKTTQLLLLAIILIPPVFLRADLVPDEIPIVWWGSSDSIGHIQEKKKKGMPCGPLSLHLCPVSRFLSYFNYEFCKGLKASN